MPGHCIGHHLFSIVLHESLTTHYYLSILLLPLLLTALATEQPSVTVYALPAAYPDRGRRHSRDILFAAKHRRSHDNKCSIHELHFFCGIGICILCGDPFDVFIRLRVFKSHNHSFADRSTLKARL